MNDDDFLRGLKSDAAGESSSSDDDAFLKGLKSTQSAAEVAAERTRKSIKHQDSGTLGEFVKGVPSGVADVGLTLAKPLYGIDTLLGNKNSYNQYNESLANRNKQLEENATPGSRVGRVAGQVVATAPLVPARGFQLIDAVATPTASAVIKGATSGGIFGAATSAANDKSLGENALEGATTGAVAGPLAEGAVKGGAVAANKAKTALDTAIQSGEFNSGATKAILQSLEEAGLTPAQARAKLQQLGPKATLADIDPSLTAEAEALAKSGGKTTSQMKERFTNRADQADYDTTHIINRNLGGNPDLDTLREKITRDAQRSVSQDYKVAHTQAGLDVQSVIDDINKELETAIGPKAAALKDIKSYFYKTVKDPQGQPIQVLKDDVKSLHEIRTQLDTRINDKNPTTSYDKNALNSVKNIRGNLDTELKTIPEMKAADEKFAERMDVLKGIDIGQNIFDRRINFKQFQNQFVNSSSEKQDIIREGIKGKVYNALEAATRGEFSEAQKLLGRGTANREKFRLAFGQSGDEVLDALEKEAAFRGTERAVEGGSRTAQIQAIQAKYGLRSGGEKSNLASDLFHGAVADALSGAPALFTATQAAKNAISGTRSHFKSLTAGKTISGAGDILSRSGVARDNAIDTLERVHAVRNRIPASNKKLRLGLPTLPTAISEYTAGQNEK